jgi:hypothetical protein
MHDTTWACYFIVGIVYGLEFEYDYTWFAHLQHIGCDTLRFFGVKMC